MKHFKKEECLEVVFNHTRRIICPDCIKHKQLNPNDFGIDCGCTNLIIHWKGKFTGQCGCFSEEHL